MTAAYRVVVADRKDIEVLTLVCPECGSEVSLAIATAGIPEYCPSCQRPYRPPIGDALAAMSRFQRTATTAEQKEGKPIFRFSIKQAD